MSQREKPGEGSPISRRLFVLEGAAIITLAAGTAARPQTRHRSQDNCVFCRIVAGKQSAFKIWDDKHHFAFLDHKPINPGHTLIIPKDHTDYLFDLSHREYSSMFDRVRELEAPLRRAMDAKRIGVIVEGFGVAHAHVHLVPLHGGGELLRKGMTGVTDAEFAAVAEKIRAEIRKV